jgi:hypothetical protein
MRERSRNDGLLKSKVCIVALRPLESNWRSPTLAYISRLTCRAGRRRGSHEVTVGQVTAISSVDQALLCGCNSTLTRLFEISMANLGLDCMVAYHAFLLGDVSSISGPRFMSPYG